MGRYGSLDYPMLAKRGAVAGFVMFAVGALGELLGRWLFDSLPPWEAALFFDLEVLGVLLFLLAPLVFGVVLPLTE